MKSNFGVHHFYIKDDSGLQHEDMTHHALVRWEEDPKSGAARVLRWLHDHLTHHIHEYQFTISPDGHIHGWFRTNSIEGDDLLFAVSDKIVRIPHVLDGDPVPDDVLQHLSHIQVPPGTTPYKLHKLVHKYFKDLDGLDNKMLLPHIF